MSQILRDVDGTPCVRDRDGDLVPVPVESATPRAQHRRDRQTAAAARTRATTWPQAPAHAPDGPCQDHGRFIGPQAALCPACWADVKAGDRPAPAIGRRLDDLEGDRA